MFHERNGDAIEIALVVKARFLQEPCVIRICLWLGCPGEKLRHERSSAKFREVRKEDSICICGHHSQRIAARGRTVGVPPLVSVECGRTQEKCSSHPAEPAPCF